MKERKEFKLIDGSFTIADAGTLLATLLDEKIRYHKLDDFSNHIRNDRDVQHSKERIAALIETKADLKAWIESVQQEVPYLIVKSTVTIEPDENFRPA